MTQRTHRGALSRRTLLRGLGAALGTAPFFRFTPSALANTTTKRLLIFFTPNSAIHSNLWRPSAGSVLSPLFDPIRPYENRTLFIDGMDFGPGVDDTTRGHQYMGMLLTGASNHYPDPANIWQYTSEGVSIDHTIANASGYAPLVIGTGPSHATKGSYVLSYSGPRTPRRQTVDVAAAFNDAFSGVSATPVSAPTQQTDAERRRQSILDFSAKHFESLIPKLPRADQIKLERHRDELRSLEHRITNPPPPVVCDPGSAPTGGSFQALMRGHIDVAVQALRCLTTNVAVLQFGASGYSGGGSPSSFVPSVQSTLPEHDLIHAWNANTATAQVTQDRVALEQFFLQQLRYTLDQLGSDLDHTLVLWVKSLGYNHSKQNIPAMLIGGETDGSYTPGRYLRQSGSHNALLASVCRIMGLGTSSYGAPAYASGYWDLT